MYNLVGGGILAFYTQHDYSNIHSYGGGKYQQFISPFLWLAVQFLSTHDLRAHSAAGGHLGGFWRLVIFSERSRAGVDVDT